MSEEALQLLSESVTQDVPRRVGGIAHRCEVLQTLLAEVHSQTAGLQNTLAERLQSVIDALSEYREESEQQRTELEEELNELTEHLQLATEVTEQRGQVLVGSTSNLQQRCEQLAQTAAGMVARIDTLVVQCDDARQTLDEEAEAAATEAETGFDALRQQMEAMRVQADDALQTVSGEVERFRQAVAERREELEERIARTSDTLDSQRKDYENSLEQLCEQVLAGGVDDMLNQLQTSIEDELKQQIDDSLARLVGLIDDIGDNLTQADSESRAIREAIEPLVEKLTEHVEPLQQAADHAQSVAANWGIG